MTEKEISVRKDYVIAIAALCLVSLVGVSYFMSVPSSDGPQSVMTTSTTLPPNTLVILEFSELMCPYCYKVESTLFELKKIYGDDIHFEWRNYPVHEGAELAAEGLECAKDLGKLEDFKMVAFVSYFDDKRDIGDALVLADLAAEAGIIGENYNIWMNCMNSRLKKNVIDKHRMEGATYGISRTPTFVIGDDIIVGAQPIEVFKKAIDNAK